MNRLGKRFLSFVCGDRSTATGLRLWEKLKGLSVSCFATDHWRSYEEFIPPEQAYSEQGGDLHGGELQ